MSALIRSDQRLWRQSLVAVWLLTAVVSLLEWRGQSLRLLQEAGVQNAAAAQALTLLGAVVDAGIGLALWWRPNRASYAAALLCVLGYTVLATVLTPAQWLHPYGPLLKNLPIAAMLWTLLRSEA
jgi:hypothetical protein